MESALRWLSTGIGIVAAGYAAHAAVTWYFYGHPSRPRAEEQDGDLDRFMPAYEVAERHHIRVDAPADTTLAAACDANLMQSPLARAIFRLREIVLGAKPGRVSRKQGVLEYTKSIGWGVLAERPGREVVMGAVTRPWEANVVFRRLPPGEFATFNEPGFVKIAWTLRADPLGANAAMFRTETRVATTDTIARARFRRYWSVVKPGIVAIRWMLLRPVKAEAERRKR